MHRTVQSQKVKVNYLSPFIFNPVASQNMGNLWCGNGVGTVEIACAGGGAAVTGVGAVQGGIGAIGSESSKASKAMRTGATAAIRSNGAKTMNTLRNNAGTRRLAALGRSGAWDVAGKSDVALLVQHGKVVGWSLTDPARYLTPAFGFPAPDPPSDATRRLLTECLDLVTEPVIYDVEDGDPAALARLRAAEEALRAQREDRHRADALLSLIGTLVGDYGDW